MICPKRPPLLTKTHIYIVWHTTDGFLMFTKHIPNIVHAPNKSLNKSIYYL